MSFYVCDACSAWGEDCDIEYDQFYMYCSVVLVEIFTDVTSMNDVASRSHSYESIKREFRESESSYEIHIRKTDFLNCCVVREMDRKKTLQDDFIALIEWVSENVDDRHIVVKIEDDTIFDSRSQNHTFN